MGLVMFDNYLEAGITALANTHHCYPGAWFMGHTGAAIFSLFQHEEVIPDQSVNGKHYFFASDQLHIITHAHALRELHKLGYESLASKGIRSLEKQIYLTKLKKPLENRVSYQASKMLDPREITFWQRNKRDPHQIKLAYSILSMLDLVDESEHIEILSSVSKYWELTS